jgi:LPS-assembly protein
MTSRIRIIRTVLTVRHLLVAAALLTCQLPGRASAQAPAAKTPPEPPSAATVAAPQTAGLDAGAASGDEVTIKAHEQTKEGEIYRLRGDVEIDIRTYTLRADAATYDRSTGEVQASGGVILDGGPHDTHVEASHAVYNVKAGTGTFFDVNGSIGTRTHGRTVVLTSPTPFLFTGRQVDKMAGDHYIVHHGTVTSCQLPRPKWTFNAETVDVVAGEDAKIYHSTFRLMGVPVFYFPYASHPADSDERKSGLLLPVIGQSTSKGTILGESAYWAINRSMDASIGGEYFSKRGWSQHGEFRARPGESSFVDLRYFGVLDRGVMVPQLDPITNTTKNVLTDEGGEDVRLTSEFHLAHDIRGVANINYLSSFLFRVSFSETYTQAINSEVKSVAFLAKNVNGYSFDLSAARYQNFQSYKTGDQILMLHMPSFETSSVERHIARSPFVWSYDAGVDGISRREPDFVTNTLVGRIDFNPRLALPLTYKGWSLRTEAGLRDTWYNQQKAADTATQVGAPINDALNRQAVEALIEFRPPALGKIFDKEILGRKLKHVIEPRVIYSYTGGVNQFQNVIRTDDRDILSNSSEVEFGLLQRLFAKRTVNKRDPLCDLLPQTEALKPGEYIPGTSAVPLRCENEGTSTREIVTWEVKQRYYFNSDFGNALVVGHRNVLTSTADFTGIAFLTEPRKWSPIVSRLRVLTSTNTDVQWDLAYDTVTGRINSSTAFVDYRVGDIFFGGSHAFLHVPGEVTTSSTVQGNLVPAPNVFNQYRALMGYGHPGKRGLSAGFSLGFDQDKNFLQYGAVQTSYNWDCCGISVEYRRFSLGTVRNNENQFRFAFTLLNLGTIGNLRRQERLF